MKDKNNIVEQHVVCDKDQLKNSPLFLKTYSRQFMETLWELYLSYQFNSVA